MQFWGDRPGFRLLVCHRPTSCRGEPFYPGACGSSTSPPSPPAGAVGGELPVPLRESKCMEDVRPLPHWLPHGHRPHIPSSPSRAPRSRAEAWVHILVIAESCAPGWWECRGAGRGAGPGQDAGPGEGQSQPGPPLEPWHFSHTQSFPLWGKDAGLECRPRRGTETRITLAVCAGTWV